MLLYNKEEAKTMIKKILETKALMELTDILEEMMCFKKIWSPLDQVPTYRYIRNGIIFTQMDKNQSNHINDHIEWT